MNKIAALEIEIRFTRLANEDLREAYGYISQDDPGSARRIIARIEKAVETLCRHTSPGRPGRVEGTREFIVPGTPFILVYRYRKRTLQILTVLHTSKKYPL